MTKPKVLNSRVKISKTGRPYVEAETLVGDTLKRIAAQRSKTDRFMTPDENDEVVRRRLEQAALAAMKNEMRDNPFLAAICSTALMVAMADLVTFESSSTK